MMRYLEGETVEPDELRRAAHDAIAQGKLVPVLCVCTRKDLGLRELLDLITDLRPQPGRHPSLRHAIGRGRRPRGRDPARRGGHAGRPGLQDRQRSVHGQAQLPADLDRPAGLRHDARQPAQRQDGQGRAHLRAPGQAAGGSPRGDRRRHRGHRQVRRPARLRHDQQRRRQHHGPAAPGPADQVPDPDGPPGRRAQGPRRRGQDLGRAGQDRRRRPDLLDPPRRPDARAGDLGHERPASGRRSSSGSRTGTSWR